MAFFSEIGNYLFGGNARDKHIEAVERALETIKLSPRTVKRLDLDGPVRLRRYDAAIPTLTQADWQVWLTSGSYEILHASRILRARARDLERNNPHVRSFNRELCNNVLGAGGIRFFSRVPNLKGPNLNKRLNGAVQDGWKDYRRKENYEVRAKWTGLEVDKMVLQRLAVDGEVLLQIVRGYDNEHRFAIQMIECDSLDVYYNSSEGPTKRVVMGIEMNDWGKPLGYHLLDYPQTSTWAENVPMKRHYVPAADLIHIYLPDRMSSVRGVTWLASVMTKMRTLERYEEATAIGNRLAAAKMGYLESTPDAQPYEGQGQTKTGETVEEIVPGLVIDLPPGKSFKPFDPKNGPQTYGDFKKGILRSIASGLGIMYNTLASDLEGISYSSARFGRDIEIETWRGLQTFYADHCLQDVFAAWLPYGILTGQINGALMSQKTLIVKNTRWAGRGWPFVDPVKETQSALNAIDGGLTTRRRELEQQGLELEDVYDEIAEEKELQEEKGLVFTNPVSKSPTQSTAENPEVEPAGAPEAAPEEEEEEEPSAPPAPKKPAAKKPPAKAK
jgi:lambda family phage portal protein